MFHYSMGVRKVSNTKSDLQGHLMVLAMVPFDMLHTIYYYTCLASENESPWAIIRRCLRDPAFSHFGTVPTCDRQTEGRTDDDSIYRASVASLGKHRLHFFTRVYLALPFG